MNKIERIEQLAVTLSLPLHMSLRVEFSLVPPNTGAHQSLPGQFDDRSLHVPNDLGSVWMEAWSGISEDLVASAVFAASPDAIQCDSIEVAPEYRRRGVATVLYDLAEELFELKATPSSVRSAEAEAFWRNRCRGD